MKKLVCLLLIFLFIMQYIVSCNEKQSDIPNDSETEQLTTESVIDDTEVESEDEVAMKEYDVSKFCIVYSTSNSLDIAFNLKTKLKAALNIDLEVKRDTVKNNKYELIIGEADRDIAKKCYYDEINIYCRKKGIVNDNGHILVLGVDPTMSILSIDYLMEKYFSDGDTKFTIPENGPDAVTASYEDIAIPEKADESYYRIISNNILLQGLNQSTARADLLKAAFRVYDADICGLQEVDDLWHVQYKLDLIMKDLGYDMVPIKTTAEYAHLKDEDIRNPIYYKADKFELIDCGYDRYNATEFEVGEEYPSSSYTWACLKDKTNGKQLIFISTHLVAKINHKGATEAEIAKGANYYREDSARQLVSAISSLEKQFPNTPVISVGDYNNNYDSLTYSIIKSRMNSARLKCEKKVNMEYHTSGNPIGGEPPKGKAIDHVFYSKSGIVAKHFETLVSPYSYAYSDHVPVLMDFILE